MCVEGRSVCVWRGESVWGEGWCMCRGERAICVVDRGVCGGGSMCEEWRGAFDLDMLS